MKQYQYPTLEQVETADKETLCRWYRFLPFAENKYQEKVIITIHNKISKSGGITPEISKSIGW